MTFSYETHHCIFCAFLLIGTLHPLFHISIVYSLFVPLFSSKFICVSPFISTHIFINYFSIDSAHNFSCSVAVTSYYFFVFFPLNDSDFWQLNGVESPLLSRPRRRAPTPAMCGARDPHKQRYVLYSQDPIWKKSIVMTKDFLHIWCR